MTDSFILPDAMRKVKADGLFDSIRRDLIADIEQKPSYITLKSSIESSMSSYLAEHQWSSSLKKSELRERARRHIETSTLIKDELPTLVNEFMQTSQEQLIQPRLTTFITDYIDHIYQSIGCNHFFRSAVPSYTPSIPIPTEPVTLEKVSPSTPPVTKVNSQSKPTVSTPSTIIKDNPLVTNASAKKISDKDKILSNKSNVIKKKPSIPPINPIKTEKKPRPSTSPARVVETTAIQPPLESKKRSASPSPPPPIVRIASPLATPKQEPSSAVRKKKRLPESKETTTEPTKKKRTKTDEQETKVSPPKTKNDSNVVEQKDAEITIHTEKNETESRRSRSRRPNPKYSQAEFETGDLHILEPSSPPPPPPPSLPSSVPSKPKKTRSFKSLPSVEHEKQESLPLDTPSSPQIDRSLSASNISPEYGAQLSTSSNVSQTKNDISETNTTKKSTSPRRLRPRKTNERSSMADGPGEKHADVSMRTSTKTQDDGRDQSETNSSSLVNETIDPIPNSTKKISSTTNIEQISQETVSRSLSAPEHSVTSTDEGPTTRSSSNTASKSFIWKPKISK